MAIVFDAVIIGAGEAGAIVANRAVQAGKRIALIYREPYGSTCVNTGCVPSKFLIARGKVADVARTAARYHITVGPPRVNLNAIIQEKNELIREHREEAFQNAQAAEGVTLFEGSARFTSSHEVEVQGQRLQADKIFIATGMRPMIPRIPGLDHVPFLTNESVMELTEVPTHLLVIGGGYIACELGQAFRRFGSQVTILQIKDHLCPREEPDVSTLLERAFVDEGIELLLGYKTTRVEQSKSGVRLRATSKQGKEQILEGSHVLVAAGRKPNTDTLDLGLAGVQTDEKGFVKVNEYLEANVAGIWAVGDVNGMQPFTRVCQEEGKIAFGNAFEGSRIKMERAFLGHAVFTDPEIGSVGFTEQDARAQGYDTVAGLVTFDKIEKAEIIGQTTGLIKYVVERPTRRLLGCHVIGPTAADLIYDAILVMRHAGTVDEIAKAVGIFPTLQEGMEGTARGLLRKLAREEATGPLATAWRLPFEEKQRAAAEFSSERRTGMTTEERPREPAKAHAAALQCPACGAEFDAQEQLADHNTMTHRASA